MWSIYSGEMWSVYPAFVLDMQGGSKKGILFHYTSIGTLQKIIDINGNEKVCLRATHAKFFNDPYEYKLAISLLKTSLIIYERENFIKQKQSTFFNKKSISSLGLIFGNPFILSFSENSDNLTMWRSYGADGRGVAIGFDKNMLDEYAEQNKNTRLIKCKYDKAAIVKGLTKYWDYVYDKTTFKEGGKGIRISSTRFIIDLSNFSFSFKRNEYLTEKEWRLCKNDWGDEQFKFLERDGLVIPYIEHYFPKEIIKQITIGPCVNKELTKESIMMLLKSRKFQIPKESIRTSKVSYRKFN